MNEHKISHKLARLGQTNIKKCFALLKHFHFRFDLPRTGDRREVFGELQAKRWLPQAIGRARPAQGRSNSLILSLSLNLTLVLRLSLLSIYLSSIYPVCINYISILSNV